MISGLYKSVAGAQVQQGRMSVISNNMANVNTHGFKKEFAVFQARQAEPIENPEVRYRSNLQHTKLGGGVYMADAWTDHHSMGGTQITNNNFDILVKGDGFMRLENVNDREDVAYKRGGRFQLSSDGRVVDADNPDFAMTDSRGNLVFLGPGDTVEFDENRGIRINGQITDRINMVSFSDADLDWLKKEGSNLYRARRELEELDFDGTIMSGHLETSTVNISEEMVEMITAQRNYELNMKMISLQDQTLERAISQVGSVPA